MAQLRLADGASADTIDWPNLGYADAYAESFEIFDRLQQDGTIPAGVRIQVQYPTPLASMAGTIVPEDMPAVAAAYEARAVRRPRQRCSAASRTTASRCSGTSRSSSACSRARWAPTHAAGAGRARPGALPRPGARPTCRSGMHLCYGDYGHQHFKQPESLQMQVDVVNAVVAAARAAAQLGVVHRPAGPRRRRLLRAAERPGRPARRPSSTSRSSRTTPTTRPRAPPRRRSSTSTPRCGGPRVGDLHRVRDGPRGGRGRPATIRSAPGDHRHLSCDRQLGGQGCAVSQVGQRPRPGVRNDTPAVAARSHLAAFGGYRRQ